MKPYKKISILVLYSSGMLKTINYKLKIEGRLYLLALFLLLTNFTFAQKKEGKQNIYVEPTLKNESSYKSVSVQCAFFDLTENYGFSISRRRKNFGSNFKYILELEINDCVGVKYKGSRVDNTSYLTYGFVYEFLKNRIRPYVGVNAGILFMQFGSDVVYEDGEFIESSPDDKGTFGLNIIGGVNVFVSNHWSLFYEPKYRTNFKTFSHNLGFGYHF